MPKKGKIERGYKQRTGRKCARSLGFEAPLAHNLEERAKKAAFAADTSCRTAGRQNQDALHLHSDRKNQ